MATRKPAADKVAENTEAENVEAAPVENDAVPMVDLSFADEAPTASRSSRYVPIFNTLRANPGKVAPIMGAVRAAVANSGGTKVPTANAVAVTFRNNGFDATVRGTEVYAGYQTTAESDESEGE